MSSKPSITIARHRRLVGRPGEVLTGWLAKCWLLAVIYLTSNVAISLPAYALLTLGLLILVGDWLLRLMVRTAATIAGARGDPSRRRWRLLTLPLVVALAAVCFMFRPALIGRVMWSQVGLTVLADFPDDAVADDDGVIWVGLFRASEIERVGSGIRFITFGHGAGDRAGLAYWPTAPGPTAAGDRYEHIAGDWWAWYPSDASAEAAPPAAGDYRIQPAVDLS